MSFTNVYVRLFVICYRQPASHAEVCWQIVGSDSGQNVFRATVRVVQWFSVVKDMDAYSAVLGLKCFVESFYSHRTYDGM